MSNSVNTDIVNNIAYVGKIRPRLSKEQRESHDDTGDFVLCGWARDPKVWVPAGASQRLYADVLRKDGREVLLVNESDYASVGEEEYVVFGDLSHVQAFCGDLGLQVDIVPVDSVKQTL